MEKRKLEKIKNAPFIKDLVDPRKSIDVNGSPTSRGYYNLVVSIRDLGLWKMGLKPHRFWKVTDVKNYFGLTGNDRKKLYDDLVWIKDYINNMD